MKETPEVDETELSLKLLVVLLRTNHNVLDLDRKNINVYGLYPTEFAVLELLFHKGEQPIQQIGKRILLASSSMTHVIDKLEQKELIERKRCANDRRVINATITKKGKVLMEDIFPKHREAVTDMFKGLSIEEKQQLVKLLKKLSLSTQG